MRHFPREAGQSIHRPWKMVGTILAGHALSASTCAREIRRADAAATRRAPSRPMKADRHPRRGARRASAPATACGSGARTTSRSTSAPARSAGSPRASRTPRDSRGTSRATSSFPATPTSTRSWRRCSGKDGIRRIDRESWIKFEDRYVRYPVPEPPLLAAGTGDARVPDRAGRVPDDRPGPRLPQLRGVGPREVRGRRREALHGPVQLQGLGHAARPDGLLLDRGAGRGRGLEEGARNDAAPAERRTGAPTRPSGIRRPAARSASGSRCCRTWATASVTASAPSCVDEEKREIRFTDGTRARIRPAADDPSRSKRSSRGSRHAPEKVRAASKRLLFNRLFSVGIGLKRPSPSHEELDLLSEPEDPLLPDDVPLELLAGHRPGRRHLPATARS